MNSVLVRSSHPTTGSELLLRHCLALVDVTPRVSAQARLESALGRKLAQYLLTSLVRGSRSN